MRQKDFLRVYSDKSTLVVGVGEGEVVVSS